MADTVNTPKPSRWCLLRQATLEMGSVWLVGVLLLHVFAWIINLQLSMFWQWTTVGRIPLAIYTVVMIICWIICLFPADEEEVESTPDATSIQQPD